MIPIKKSEFSFLTLGSQTKWLIHPRRKPSGKFESAGEICGRRLLGPDDGGRADAEELLTIAGREQFISVTASALYESLAYVP